MVGKQKRRSQIPGLVLACFVLAAQIYAARTTPKSTSAGRDRSLRNRSTQLDSIKTALLKGRQKLDSLKKREGTGLAQLDQTETNIKTAGDYLRELSGRIDASARRLKLLEDSLAGAERELSKRQAIMKQRLRTMYITGLGRPNELEDVRFLLMSRSITDALRRIRDFRALREYDRMLLDRIDSGRTVVAAHASAVGAEMESLASLRTAKEREQKLLMTERVSQQELLRKIRSEKESYAALVKQLEESQRKLRDLIETLVKQQRDRGKKQAPAPKGPTVFDKKKGGLPWPMQGGTVVTGFGMIVHPVYKTTIMNNGIEIRSSADPTVRCVASGSVVYLGWMRGLGQFAMVDHADGFLSIYARLADITVSRNQNVTAGTPIGSVAPGDDLHFEFRKGADPLDPREWLE